MKTARPLTFLLIPLILGCGFFGNDDEKAMPNSQELDLPADAVQLCGNAQIMGVRERDIKNGACGIDNPVRVYSVSGIRLENSALINCTAASRLNDWTQNTAKKSAMSVGKELKSMKVVASYACRTRNHRKGARLSEHAYGNAVDLTEFTFTDGTKASVLADFYNKGDKGKFMRNLHSGACGPFGTVLGPNSDKFHRDHFHLDVASYSYGPYCK